MCNINLTYLFKASVMWRHFWIRLNKIIATGHKSQIRPKTNKLMCDRSENLWIKILILTLSLFSAEAVKLTVSTPYLLIASGPVCVVQLVGEDLSVASERLLPAERNWGWCVWHRLQVWSGPRHLHWWKNNEKGKQRLGTKQLLCLLMFSVLGPQIQFARQEKESCNLKHIFVSDESQMTFWFSSQCPDEETEGLLQQKHPCRSCICLLFATDSNEFLWRLL